MKALQGEAPAFHVIQHHRIKVCTPACLKALRVWRAFSSRVCGA
jgi:hypothetical protein